MSAAEEKEPESPTDKSKRGKPLKLGFLWVLTGKLKKKFKYQFCILTTHGQLDFYKKQEDCVDHRTAGSIKKLPHAELDEIEDVLGQTNCFSIKVSGKVHQLAADTEQERLNWMVEILKLRGIQALINLLESPDLHRHAAYALANLAGRKSDDSQILIVKYGGIAPLLQYQRNCEEQTLVDTIYYAIAKLSSKEENRLEIGKNMKDMYQLLAGDNSRWKEFALETICNCTTLDTIQSSVRTMDGLKPFVEILADASSTTKMRDFASRALYNCVEHDPNKMVACQTLLSDILAVLGKSSPSVQESLVLMLHRCSEKSDALDLINQSTVVEAILPLVARIERTLQLTVARFLMLLAKFEHQRAIIRREPNGLDDLMLALTSDNIAVMECALIVLDACWCKDPADCRTMVRDSANLCSLFPLIAHDNLVIRSLSLRLVHTLSEDRETVEILAKRGDAVAEALQHFFVRDIRWNTQEELSLLVLETLLNMSEADSIKLEMCRNAIIEKLLSYLNDLSVTDAYAYMMVSILRNASSAAAAKLLIGRYQRDPETANEGGVHILLSLIVKRRESQVCEVALGTLANITCFAENAMSLLANNGLSILLRLLSPSSSLSSSSVGGGRMCRGAATSGTFQEQIARIIMNVSGFKPAAAVILETQVIENLVSLMESPSERVREASISALLNCLSTIEQRMKLMQLESGIACCEKALMSTSIALQTAAARILGVCVSPATDGSSVVSDGLSVNLGAGMASALVALLESPDSTVVEAAMFALCQLSACDESFVAFLREARPESLLEFLGGSSGSAPRSSSNDESVGTSRSARPPQREGRPEHQRRVSSRLQEFAARIVDSTMVDVERAEEILPYFLPLLEHPMSPMRNIAVSVTAKCAQNPNCRSQIVPCTRHISPLLLSSSSPREVQRSAALAIIRSCMQEDPQTGYAQAGVVKLAGLPDVMRLLWCDRSDVSSGPWSIRQRTDENGRLCIEFVCDPLESSGLITFSFENADDRDDHLARALLKLVHGEGTASLTSPASSSSGVHRHSSHHGHRQRKGRKRVRGHFNVCHHHHHDDPSITGRSLSSPKSSLADAPSATTSGPQAPRSPTSPSSFVDEDDGDMGLEGMTRSLSPSTQRAGSSLSQSAVGLSTGGFVSGSTPKQQERPSKLTMGVGRVRVSDNSALTAPPGPSSPTSSSPRDGSGIRFPPGMTSTAPPQPAASSASASPHIGRRSSNTSVSETTVVFPVETPVPSHAPLLSLSSALATASQTVSSEEDLLDISLLGDALYASAVYMGVERRMEAEMNRDQDRRKSSSRSDNDLYKFVSCITEHFPFTLTPKEVLSESHELRAVQHVSRDSVDLHGNDTGVGRKRVSATTYCVPLGLCAPSAHSGRIESAEMLRKRAAAPPLLVTLSPVLSVGGVDGAVCEYKGQKHASIAGSALSTRPLSVVSSMPYFEVYVMDSGFSGSIAVGLATANYPHDQQPGWSAKSWAYHLDDGNKYWCVVDEQRQEEASSSASFSAARRTMSGCTDASAGLSVTESNDAESNTEVIVPDEANTEDKSSLKASASSLSPSPPAAVSIEAPETVSGPNAEADGSPKSPRVKGNSAGSSSVKESLPTPTTLAPAPPSIPISSASCGWRHQAFGPTCRRHDVIGCGLNVVTNEIFFTRNGILLDTAFAGHQTADLGRHAQLPLYPVVGLASPGEKVYVNVGQRPFMWNGDPMWRLNYRSAPLATYGDDQPPPAEPNYLSQLRHQLAMMWSVVDAKGRKDKGDQ